MAMLLASHCAALELSSQPLVFDGLDGLPSLAELLQQAGAGLNAGQPAMCPCAHYLLTLAAGSPPVGTFPVPASAAELLSSFAEPAGAALGEGEDASGRPATLGAGSASALSSAGASPSSEPASAASEPPARATRATVRSLLRQPQACLREPPLTQAVHAARPPGSQARRWIRESCQTALPGTQQAGPGALPPASAGRRARCRGGLP